MDAAAVNVPGKCFPAFCSVGIYSLDLDLGPARGCVRLQVSDLNGRRNPGGWPCYSFLLGLGPRIDTHPSGEIFLFSFDTP